jgi:hypothetical protein
VKPVYPTSIEEVEDIGIKTKLIELKEKEYILGFLLQGSRVTGFGAPDTDWDIVVYCTDEYFDSLDYDTIMEFTFVGSGPNKKMVGDFVYFSDQIFKQQNESPMDIDHVPYTLSIVLWDKTGKLNKWVQTLANFPEEEYEDRVRMQLVQLLVAFGYARINNERQRHLDTLVNLTRTLTISFTYWFTLNKSWTPQHKWWSDHVKRLKMDDETYNLYQAAIESQNYENVKNLVNHLKNLTESKGIKANYRNDFFSTLMTHGRPKYIRASHF